MHTNQLSHGQGTDVAVLTVEDPSLDALGSATEPLWGTGMEVSMRGRRECLGFWAFVSNVHQGQSVVCPAHLKQTCDRESVTCPWCGSEGIGVRNMKSLGPPHSCGVGPLTPIFR